MNCSDNNNCSSCIFDILKTILNLQRQNFDNDSFFGCDKPFLGPINNTLTYNTRPIQLYICANGSPWTFDYTLADGTTGTSDVFRIESLDDCCCTCRILYLDDTNIFYLNSNGSLDPSDYSDKALLIGVTTLEITE